MKCGQQYGNEAVLFVRSVSNLHLSFANGRGPQSSTNSNNLSKKNCFLKKFLDNKCVCTHCGDLSWLTTQVDRPQNGVRSHVLPGSTVAQRVDAKHIPGKSKKCKKKWLQY